MAVIRTARLGMRAGAARLDSAAYNIAVAGADSARPVLAVQAAAPQGGVLTNMSEGLPAPIDVASALVDAMEAGITYRANASVTRAADGMIGMLFDRSG